MSINNFLLLLAGAAFFILALRRPGEPFCALSIRASKWLLGAALIFGVLAILYLRASPSASLNYKLSVDVDNDGVQQHGEGVIHVVFQAQPILIGQTPPWTIGPVGEAFPVDLGSKGTFFVLLSGDRSRRSSIDAGSKGALYYYFHLQEDGPTESVLAKFIALGESHAAVNIRLAQLPMLVRFRDLNDPKSIEIVDPDHLDLSFGSGVKITGVRAEITSEPVTRGIENRLGWLKSGAYERWIFEPHGELAYQVPPLRMITYGDFATSGFWRSH